VLWGDPVKYRGTDEFIGVVTDEAEQCGVCIGNSAVNVKDHSFTGVVEEVEHALTTAGHYCAVSFVAIFP
jgi:hypothetical protein